MPISSGSTSHIRPKAAGREDWSYYPLANIYMQQYKWKIKEKDLRGFAGSQHVPDLKIIKNYVFGVTTPPEA